MKSIEYFHNLLNSKFSAIDNFVDFRKAFGTLNHTILIRKLEAYGICHFPLKLIVNYLQNRKLKLNNIFSSVWDITLGVPNIFSSVWAITLGVPHEFAMFGSWPTFIPCLYK